MLVQHTFGGPGFLPDVRKRMNSGGGVFAALDGAFRYVFLDADFFRLEVLQRKPSEKFTAAAIASTARVVANGQTFASYCATPGDCAVKWQGEVVSKAITLPGEPPHAPSFRYFGQGAGASASSFIVAKGDPGQSVPPLVEAIGRLLPLVEGKSVAATPATSGTFWPMSATIGKAAYGVARDINAVLVIVQQHGEIGLMLPQFAALVAGAGVDQAAMGDGSDSATLVVDKVVEVTPGDYIKNRAIPDGPAFIQRSLSTTPASALRNNPASTDPRFLTDFSATGTQGSLAIDNSGIKLILVSLGVRGDTGHDLALDLGVPLPAIVSAASAQLPPPPGTPMTGGPLTLTPSMTRPPGTAGVLTGQLRVATAQGSVTLDVNWPLATT
ncbi:Predicted protein [Geodermatophilus amargosae]|uniref:Phosphodiester glycosidase domain-containing protein n=1 Tax=Geodermatophilus amargosae TaxID=1296565 RepID=A0A1I7CVZ3_9ACTN|nr:phosphodiester glycosidase family protein [Geodermatophilus amargosae]SFU03578.1 Predicted protein [Geodermatophilus amargosae]